MKILLQCLLRQRAHFLNAWANAITSGLKNHLSLAAMFCGQSILVAGSGEHLITLAQWLEYYSGKQKASVQTSYKAKERTQPLSSTNWMSLASWILGMGLLLHPWHDSWCLATGKNGGLDSLLSYFMYFHSQWGIFCGPHVKEDSSHSVFFWGQSSPVI